MKNIYRFFWDCGRQGDVEGVFAATPEQITNLIGQQVYFGEILGKHSEVCGDVSEKDITLITDDQDFVEKAVEYSLVPTGYNPLSYLREEYEADDIG